MPLGRRIYGCLLHKMGGDSTYIRHKYFHYILDYYSDLLVLLASIMHCIYNYYSMTLYASIARTSYLLFIQKKLLKLSLIGTLPFLHVLFPLLLYSSNVCSSVILPFRPSPSGFQHSVV